MQWYWWVLIGVLLVGFVTLKVVVGGKVLRKMKENRDEKQKRMEED